MGKVLITEKVHPVGPQLLRAAGHQVVQVENRDMAQIAREIIDADAVIVRIIDLPGSLLGTAEHLRIVSKHGVGVDNIDLDYCRKAGVAVTVTPNANSLSVAEHAFTLMLTLAKNIIPVSNAYREIGFAAKNSREGVEAVSYTHLDVYKRQTVIRETDEDEPFKSGVLSRSRRRAEPVSYTHLFAF